MYEATRSGGLRPRGHAPHPARHLRAVGRLLRRVLSQGPAGARADRAGLRARVRSRASICSSRRPRPAPAFELGARGEPYEMYLSDVFTCTANLAGIPALSLPIGRVDGLPVGGQLHRAALRGAPDVGRRVRARARAGRRGAPMSAAAHAAGVPLDERFEMVVGLEVHVQLATRDQDLLPVFGGVRRAAQREQLPGVSRTSRRAAGAERPRGGAGGARGVGARLHDPFGVDLRAEELLLSRSPEGLSDLAIRSAAGDGRPRGDRRGRGGPGHARAHRGGRRQVDSRPVRRRRRPSTSTGPACR